MALSWKDAPQINFASPSTSPSAPRTTPPPSCLLLLRLPPPSTATRTVRRAPSSASRAAHSSLPGGVGVSLIKALINWIRNSERWARISGAFRLSRSVSSPLSQLHGEMAGCSMGHMVVLLCIRSTPCRDAGTCKETDPRTQAVRPLTAILPIVPFCYQVADTAINTCILLVLFPSLSQCLCASMWTHSSYR